MKCLDQNLTREVNIQTQMLPYHCNWTQAFSPPEPCFQHIIMVVDREIAAFALGSIACMLHDSAEGWLLQDCLMPQVLLCYKPATLSAPC